MLEYGNDYDENGEIMGGALFNPLLSKPSLRNPDVIENTFPVHALPPILSSMVADVANLMQVDESMVATSALATIAACVSSGKIKLNSQDSEAPLTLFALVVAAPSEGKSGVLQALNQPLYDIEEELLEKYKLKRSSERGERRLIEQRLFSAEKAAKGGDANSTADFHAAHQALESFQETPSPRMIYDDVTPEALVEKMCGNGRAFIASAEGGIFQTIGGRYSNGVSNLDAILKGYNGESLSVDRKGADPLVLKRPLLTLNLMVQQHTWNEIRNKGDFMGRGFIHRFLIVEPTSKVGDRSFTGKKSDLIVRNNYATLIGELVETFTDCQPTLIMSGDADRVFARYSQLTEKGLRVSERFGGSAIHTEWGGKLFPKALRICGILHCAETGKNALAEPVTGATAENAVLLAEWFATEFLRLMPLIPAAETLAELIMEWVEGEKLAQFSQTDVTRHFRNRQVAKETRAALAFLLVSERLGTKKTKNNFGRPAELYFPTV